MATKFISFYIVLKDESLYNDCTTRDWSNGNDPGRPAGEIHTSPYGACSELGLEYRHTDAAGAAVAPFPGPSANGYVWTPVNASPLARALYHFQDDDGDQVYWTATFVLEPGATSAQIPDPDFIPTPGNPTPPLVLPRPRIPMAPMAQRRYVDGAEMPDGAHGGAGGEGGSGSAVPLYVSRDASRHLGGLGWAFRNAGNQTRTHNPVELTGETANTVKKHWDRFYFRVRTFPSVSDRLYYASSAKGANQGLSLEVTPDGKLAVYDGTSTAKSLLAVLDLQLELDVWYRVDLLLQALDYPQAALDASESATDGSGGANAAFTGTSIRVFGPGEVFAGWVGHPLGLQAASFAPTSYISQLAIGGLTAGSGFCFDVDDWIGSQWPAAPASIPVNANGLRASWGELEPWSGLDWINGSRVLPLRGTGFGAGNQITGDFRVLLQNPQQAPIIQALASSVASTVVELDTDADVAIDAAPGTYGLAAMVVGTNCSNVSTADGQVGYTVGGVTVAQTKSFGTLGWRHALYSANTTYPSAVAPVRIRAIKPASADAFSIRALGAVAEVVGKFSAVDERIAWKDQALDADDGIPSAELTARLMATRPLDLPHNHPYPESVWANPGGVPPMSPVKVFGGTYAGNGTGQDLTFDVPIHWLWVRPLTGDLGGGHWWSGLVAAHRLHALAPTSAAMVQARQDPTVDGGTATEPSGSYQLRIAGSEAQSNASGVTYQYIAFSDPGQRFLLNGAGRGDSSLASVLRALVDTGFTPEAAFFFVESIGTTSTATHAFKGPGHAAAAASVLGAAETADYATFGAGTLTTATPLHGASNGYGFALWRRADGHNDPGQPAVLALGSYVGDGTASRSVGVAPSSGKRPLFLLVVGSNGTTLFRDPSHTGTTSSTHLGANNASTGITGGGVDSFSVGSTLNTSGVTYNWFLLPGSATAGNGGWSINGEYEPVDPALPLGNQWPQPEPGDEDTFDEGEVGPADPGDLTTDIAADCVAASTRLVNIALSFLGISQSIAPSALGTEQSREAASARLHFKTDADEVLRAFPWAMATAYASPTLVEGDIADPANGDWTYVYRAPADCVFVRRIVRPGFKRKFDPDPPAFRVSSDDDGDLIFTDEEDPEIEYTRRVPCPAGSRDAIFRKALAYRHASSLAQALGRDEKIADRMLRNYLGQVRLAEVKAAQEQQHQDPDPGGDAEWIRAR